MGQEQTKPSVLYVEYYKSLQTVLTYLMKIAGYDVTEYDNLQDAEGHAERQRFHVYVSGGSYPLTPGGQKVPHVGLDFYDKIRQMHQGPLNLVIVSGDNTLEDICVERDIRFFNMSNLFSKQKGFKAYLQSLQQ